jgi:hypothetical protein
VIVHAYPSDPASLALHYKRLVLLLLYLYIFIAISIYSEITIQRVHFSLIVHIYPFVGRHKFGDLCNFAEMLEKGPAAEEKSISPAFVNVPNTPLCRLMKCPTPAPPFSPGSLQALHMRCNSLKGPLPPNQFHSCLNSTISHKQP